MLIENPHYLARIHSRTAAESDNAVGCEIGHLLGSCNSAGKRRVGSDIKECGVDNAHFVELIRYRLGITVAIEESVRYDKGTLLTHDIFQLIESDRQTAFLYIHLFGSAEPEHILSPFGNCFYIEQMLYTYIFGNAVSAP